MSGPVPDVFAVRSANWGGSIPIVLTLAPTSLSSPTVPPPLHRMVNRMTYLHVGLADEVRRLYKFAPATLAMGGFRRGGEEGRGLGEDDDEEEDKEEARHPSTPKGRPEAKAGGGDSDAVAAKNGNDRNGENRGGHGRNNSRGGGGSVAISGDASDSDCETKLPVCWFEDEATGIAMRWHLFAGVLYDLARGRRGLRSDPGAPSAPLPWGVRVHFTSYPTHQILSFADGNVMRTIERTFNNSLKQALFLQHGSSKVAMSLSKAGHQKLWDALKGSNYNLYEEVNGEGLQATATGDGKDVALHNVPVRVLVDGKPAIQRPCRALIASPSEANESETISAKRTLGDVLSEWVPRLFTRHGIHGPSHDVLAGSNLISWAVQGIVSIPLNSPIVDVWRCLCHPDHFLYICVVTKSL